MDKTSLAGYATGLVAAYIMIVHGFTPGLLFLMLVVALSVLKHLSDTGKL